MEKEVHAQTQVWKHIYGFAESLTLKCAIELRVPNVLHKHGKPMTLSEIYSRRPHYTLPKHGPLASHNAVLGPHEVVRQC